MPAAARTQSRPEAVYASCLLTQKRLRLAHQATDANACPTGTVAFPCATPSRLSCAGVIQTPVPLWVAKRIQSPPKSVASIGIPCKMRFFTQRLLLLQRYDYPKVVGYSNYSKKKEHPTLHFWKLETLKLQKRSEKSSRMFFFHAYSSSEI